MLNEKENTIAITTEMFVKMSEHDHYSGYHLHGWSDADDPKMMMGMYYAEQTSPYPHYIKQLDAFIADWKAGTYEPACAFCFQPCDVEELGVVSEEVKEEKSNGKEKEKTPPPRPRARATKKKHRHRE